MPLSSRYAFSLPTFVSLKFHRDVLFYLSIVSLFFLILRWGRGSLDIGYQISDPRLFQVLEWGCIEVK